MAYARHAGLPRSTAVGRASKRRRGRAWRNFCPMRGKTAVLRPFGPPCATAGGRTSRPADPKSHPVHSSTSGFGQRHTIGDTGRPTRRLGLVDGSHGVRPCSQALPPRVSNQSTHSTISLTPVPRRHGRVTRVSDSNVQVPKPTALARSSSGRSGIHELKEIVGGSTRAHSEPSNRTVIVRHQRQVVMGSSRLSDRSGRGVQGPTRRPRCQRSR